jgi:hypothetical protein
MKAETIVKEWTKDYGVEEAKRMANAMLKQASDSERIETVNVWQEVTDRLGA